jgi:hypothetical protein
MTATPPFLFTVQEGKNGVMKGHEEVRTEGRKIEGKDSQP